MPQGKSISTKSQHIDAFSFTATEYVKMAGDKARPIWILQRKHQRIKNQEQSNQIPNGISFNPKDKPNQNPYSVQFLPPPTNSSRTTHSKVKFKTHNRKSIFSSIELFKTHPSRLRDVGSKLNCIQVTR